jgi:hypothetical protein
MADRWGRVVYWVHIPARRVVERKEMGSEILERSRACMAQASLSLSFFQIFQMLSMLGLFLGWS